MGQSSTQKKVKREPKKKFSKSQRRRAPLEHGEREQVRRRHHLDARRVRRLRSRGQEIKRGEARGERGGDLRMRRCVDNEAGDARGGENEVGAC